MIKQSGEHSIKLMTDGLAKSVWLQLPGTDNAFDDNYFDLLPDEKKIIQVKATNLKAVMNAIQIKNLVDAY